MEISVFIIWRVSFHLFGLSPIKLTEQNNCCQLTTGFLKLVAVAILNVIHELVLFSSCHISLAISIHFACTRSFFLVVLTQFCCYFKIAPNCELVVTGDTLKTRCYLQNVILIYYCNRLQECVLVFSKHASHFGHGISEKFCQEFPLQWEFQFTWN